MDFTEILKNLPYSFLITFNPKKGEGWTEVIMATMIVITFCLTIALNREVPPILVGIMGTLLGFYFGNQNTKYKE